MKIRNGVGREYWLESQETWILFWSAIDLLSLHSLTTLVCFIICEVENFAFSKTQPFKSKSKARGGEFLILKEQEGSLAGVTA